jgi:hypothetical protein
MEKIDQILDSLYDRVIEPCEAKEQLLRLFDVSGSLPRDFDEWIEKVEKECNIDMDLPIIIWHDFFKPRGIYPKHAKGNDR